MDENNFELNGKRYISVDIPTLELTTCESCAFDTDNDLCNQTPECLKENRIDRTEVYFIEVTPQIRSEKMEKSTYINAELAWPCYACVNNNKASLKFPCDRCKENCQGEPTKKGYRDYFEPIPVLK